MGVGDRGACCARRLPRRWVGRGLMSAPRWAEVWDVDFGNPVGHEQGKQRPAVVVSADWFNETRAQLHFVVPISSTIRGNIGTHYRIDAPAGGPGGDSEAMCEHRRS